MSEYATILKGAWSITEKNSRDIFGEHEYVDNVQNVVCFELPAGQGFRVGSTSFDRAFSSDSHEHIYYQSLLQAILRCNGRIRRSLEGKKNETVNGVVDGEPLQVLMEVVIANEANPLMESMQFGSTPEGIRSRPFMRGVNDDVDVLGYRLWVFLRYNDPLNDYGLIWFALLEEAQKYYNTYVEGNLQQQEGDDGNEGVSLSSFTGGESLRYGQSLKEGDAWKLLRSKKLYAEVLDMMLGVRKYTRKKTLDRIMSQATTVLSNPANPIYSLSPDQYFRYPTDNILDAQSIIANYRVTTDGKRWTMPRPDLVVRVTADDQNYDRFSKKLFPDYQVRSIGDDLVDDQCRRARVRASKHYARISVGTGRNSILRRNMRHSPLAAGEAGDIDLTMDVTASSLIDGAVDPLGDEILNSDAQGPRFVEQGIAFGGNSPSEINSMIDSAAECDEKGNLELYDAATLAREDFEGADSASAQRLLSVTDAPDISDFHLVRHLGASLRSRLTDRIIAAKRRGEVEAREDSRRAYVGIQNRIIRDYQNLCMSSTSDISDRAQRINMWFERRQNEDRIKLLPENERTWLGVDEPLMDAGMSTFANMLARRMLRLEASAFVTTTHSIILTLLFGTLDAYRHEFNLHFHALLTGPNSSGKSFICEKVRDLRIHDTVRKVDTSTDKADYVDTCHNDQIDYCEEIKPASYMTGAMGGDDNKESAEKEFLTSMVRTIKAFHKEKSGRRSQRIAYSQQITARIGCTNLHAHQISAPMLSRHTVYPVEIVERQDRVTSHMHGVQKRLDVDAGERCSAFRDEISAEQYLHYHVEKLLASHALTEPTLTAFNAVNQIFTSHLKHHHNIRVHPRTVERMSIMARQLTISAALELLFSSPHSKYFKQPYSVTHLRDIDELLYDSEEIAYCAIDAMRHEIIDGKRPVVMNLMKKVYVEVAIAKIMDQAAIHDVDTRMRDVYMMPATKFTSSRYGSDTDFGSSAVTVSSSHKRLRGSFSAYPKNDTHNEIDASVVVMMANDKFSPEYMYAYYRVEGNYISIASRIATVSTMETKEISVDSVREVMREMSKSYIVSDRYRWDAANKRPVVDERHTQVQLPALIYAKDCVFVALTSMSGCDAITEAINRCQSNLLETPRKYISMVPIDNEHPHLLRTRTVDAASGKAHSVVDYARQMTASSIYGYSSLGMLSQQKLPNITTGARLIRRHYDEMSRRERAEAIFLDPDDPNVCSVDAYEKTAHEPLAVDDVRRESHAMRHVLLRSCNYPQGIIDMDATASDRHLLGDVQPVDGPVSTNAAIESSKGNSATTIYDDSRIRNDAEVDAKVDADVEVDVDADNEKNNEKTAIQETIGNVDAQSPRRKSKPHKKRRKIKL